jgi:two-component system nitrogen regulation response regulator GlnG
MFPRSTRAKDFLVAHSPAMQAVVAKVNEYADADSPVLVCGEHGTGRELVARVLHQSGPRRHRRFIAVRPTFEGAEVPSPGAGDAGDRARSALRAAAGGTLLVKDVCDVPASSQRTLRKAMKQQAGTRESSDEVFDVRIVGSSDLDLEAAVSAKIVSRELYEQLAARRIDLPALRQRIDDVPTLAERWINHYAREVGRDKLTVSSRAHARLQKYPWPGNVGELKSVARRLVVRVSRARIEAGDIDEVLPAVAERVPLEDMAFEEMVRAKLAGFLDRMDGYPVHDLYERICARVERPLFDLVLERTGGNQVKAAEILGLNRNTLRKKLDEMGLHRKKKQDREDEALDGE